MSETLRYYAPGRTFDVTYRSQDGATAAMNRWIDFKIALTNQLYNPWTRDELMIWIGGHGVACLADVVSIEFVEEPRE